MKYLLLLIGSCWLHGASAQFMTQSADGKGSIPLPLKGAGVTVDIGKSEVVFGVNNYQRVFDSVKNVNFFGINVSGKNKEGLANLFKAGDIVPEGNLLLIAGRSFSNNQQLSKRYHDDTAHLVIRRSFDSIRIIQAVDFPNDIISDIYRHRNHITDTSKRQYVITDLTEKVNNSRSDQIPALLTGYGTTDPDIRTYMDSVRISGQRRLDIARKKISAIQTRIAAHQVNLNQRFTRDVYPWRVHFFAQGGITAREFKRYIGLTPPDFGNSFKDTLFRGGHFGLGANIMVRNFWLGITYSYLKTDNFAALSSKEYTLRKTDTSGNNVLIQEKKITAYPGKYSRVEVNELNIDFVADFRLNKKDTSRLLINPYLRASLHSRDTAYLKNFTNIGLGIYFLGNKRKFIGGFYVELPDINNNIEKAKPADEMNIPSPFKKLSFGISTKFNLSSIFNFTNRAVKSD